MSSFINYLSQDISLERRLEEVFNELEISPEQRKEIEAFMAILKLKDRMTYDHSIRVALLATRIGNFMHLDPKVLLYSGLLHDTGKAQTNPATLKKTSGWTGADTAEIMSHVMDGYRLIRGHFDFSAEVILWHHRFQPNSYPTEIPQPLHDYSEGTRVMIPFFGRILALADQFDALHRMNDKFTRGEKPIGESIKETMLAHNPDQRKLIEELYRADILTVRIFSDEYV
jgi:putative nucleotidyltransferase with HDIG domain